MKNKKGNKAQKMMVNMQKQMTQTVQRQKQEVSYTFNLFYMHFLNPTLINLEKGHKIVPTIKLIQNQI